MSFRVGEKVVYPNHGVSVVEKIGEGFGTEPVSPRSFYHLRLLANNSKVMVPIGNTDLIGLRRLTQRKDITGLMKMLADGRFSATGDWKGRYKQNLDKMKSGRLQDIADVLKTLNYISARKTLSFREKKMYERARYLIISEIAVINGMDEGEVERQVDRALAKSAQMRNATIRTPELRASH
ncbi:MAG TPA: CarD family transcriptional regulator [Thermoanaerobaculia bacterium]|nr:CarD family transcriptional regulator [Thermoanaerobaculia bacterium]